MSPFRSLLAGTLIVAALALPGFAADVLVVCPPTLRAGLERWVQYRQGQGHTVRVIAPPATSVQLRREVVREGAAGNLKALLLIGDCAGAADGDKVVPAGYVTARVIPRFGGERQIVTDNVYADLDNDQLPDIAVGRLTADNATELGDMIEKIIACESSSDFGLWRRRVNLVAGVGGFGPLVDGMIEGTTKMFLTAGIPAGYRTSMTQASWTSPYCPDPRRFCDTAVGRMNEGCLFWIYMGHGNPRSLDSVNVPGGRFRIMSAEDTARVRCRHPAPAALFFSCYAGALDADEDCLAEEILRQPSGPAAVIAGSRVTMPYAMATLGNAMLDEFFQQRRATLGEVFLRAKRSMVAAGPHDQRRKAIDSLGKLFSGPGHDLAQERAEHLNLFNLFGDPLLRLRYPQTVEISAPDKAGSGTTITVRGRTPVAGHAVVELVLRRDRLACPPPRREKFTADHEFLESFQQVYQAANDSRLATAECDAAEGEFAVSLQVPPDAVGPCHVRIYVSGVRDFAMGARDIRITPSATLQRRASSQITNDEIPNDERSPNDE